MFRAETRVSDVPSLAQNGSLTEKNFLVMLDIVLVDTVRIASAVDTRLDVGDYMISCQDALHTGIRARDGRCVISSVVNRMAPYDWTFFQAALEKVSLWLHFNYGRWITDMDDTKGATKSSIPFRTGFFSRQISTYCLINTWVSVNLDDNDKITVFGVDLLGIDGRILYPFCRDPTNPHHSRNMRRAGEPVFEHDFPQGTDMMGEIREGPYAQERLEMEFAWRLSEELPIGVFYY
ncbi:hypothetical protein FN846DRAFT_1027706 [Sphaerosporella brunnea]|uniref:Uncharacterized protein n=1 Tax=Sphaerosporella brunnea TaxID=1250544 RepID=A0A5J5F115_9PEZI|nr:hypothetical protein FN846DRAFT_1027706 [Sphaerosporella brunnea]